MITAKGLTQLGFTPEVDFSLMDNSDGKGVFIHEWMSIEPQPSEADITTAHNEWQAEYEANKYQRDRVLEYPSIGDQLDMIYHSGLGGPEFQAAIKAVKDAHPKGDN